MLSASRTLHPYRPTNRTQLRIIPAQLKLAGEGVLPAGSVARYSLLSDISDIRLPDNRRLAYAEYGDRTGVTVFVFHGLPGSRLGWSMLPDNSLPATARIVAPNRPGYGASDPNPGRTLLDWAEDVEALAHSLEIGKFAIVGISDGGPGTLACAWKMPERLTAFHPRWGPTSAARCRLVRLSSCPAQGTCGFSSTSEKS